MKEKAILFAALLALNAVSENTKYGIGVGVNAVYTNVIFAKVPSLSFYVVKEACIHDISAEYTACTIFVEPYEEMALIYSYLRYLPSKYFLLGPSIGVLFSEYQKWSLTQDAHGFAHETWDIREGRYFFGIKGMIKICKNHFGLTISDRLMFGDSRINGPIKIGVSNLLGAGLISVL